MTIWEPTTIAPGTWRVFRFDKLTILIQNTGEEWRHQSWSRDAPEITESGKNSDLPSVINPLDWIRWDCSEGDAQIKLAPAFPNLPLIASPLGQITIAPGGSALFHLGIPPDIQIHAECAGQLTLIASIKSNSLSKTWHGTKLAGKPCFALRTNARRKINDFSLYTDEIICQVDISNKDDQPMKFERLYLETDHHSIFLNQGQLWANASRIKISDITESSTRIVYTDKPLPPAAKAIKLTEPIGGKARKSILKNTFSSFIDIFN